MTQTERRARSSGPDVLIVDDEPLIRAGLRLVLDGAQGIVIVGEAGDGVEGEELADVVRVDLPQHGLPKCCRRTGTLPQQQAKDVGIILDKLHEGMHRGPDDAATPTGDAQPRLTHQLTQGEPPLIHQRQAQLIHVAKVAIERGGGNTRFTSDFPQAEIGETPVGTQLAECSIDQCTPGFFFLLSANTHRISHLQLIEAK